MFQLSYQISLLLGAILLTPVPETVIDAARGADVVIIGEVHDNPQHHLVQSSLIEKVQPKAIVFEMLDADQAQLVTPKLRDDPAALAEILDWQNSGWPDFEQYAALFSAVPGATIYGAALPRGEARTAMQNGTVKTFGNQAAAYGLDLALSQEQQTTREDMQFSAHCDALPRHLLPDMVDLQRLRDAMLARAIVQALETSGPPVVVITGNGHARRDWGIPFTLAKVVPNAVLYVIGQGEDAYIPEGGFDVVLDAPAQSRPDPCDAFR